MNVGERDELIAILKLIEMKNNNIPFFGELIQSLKNGDIECTSLPAGFDLNNIHALNDGQLVQFAKQCGVSKAPGRAKADIEINGIGQSIKSNRSAAPALVNHTARPGFENVCLNVGSDINTLDTLIEDYWKKRNGKIISEDIKNSDPNSPFKDHIEYFRPILNYFLFTGTGSGDSRFPAERILKFTNPLHVSTWTQYDENNALDLFWDKLVFSLRAKKGMPAGYPDEMSAKAILNKPSVDIWTEYIDGDFRGALHIRATK